MINKLFPKTDYSKIKYDVEGLYSITNPFEANYISNIIKSHFYYYENLKILDGTGGLGGNTINFAKHFKSVTSIEINNERYKMLVNNINTYKIKNINTHCLDSVDYLYKNYKNYDVYFFDPPWGGPKYKQNKLLSLSLGLHTLVEIINFIKKNINNKLLIYKLPFNYNFNEFNLFDYKLYKIKNYYLIVFLI